MNNVYLDEYTSLFGTVLSYAYKIRYSLDALAREVSYSSFFQEIEKDRDTLPSYITDRELLMEIFNNTYRESLPITSYNQCLWAAESYLRIQEETKLTFEAIFIYLPIEKIYQYFDLYHEMDFSQIVKEFIRLFNEESVLSILMKKYGYSLKGVSEKLDISYDTLKSLKNRTRDVKKVDINIIYKLSSFFNVRMETIAELSL